MGLEEWGCVETGFERGVVSVLKRGGVIVGCRE